MKKTVSVICLVVALVLMASCVLAEEVDIRFEPSLTNVLDYDADEWFESSLKRALLTIMLSLDCEEFDEELGSEIVGSTSYVGYAEDEGALMIIWEAESKKKMILYVPGGTEASYMEHNNGLSLSTWVTLVESELDVETKKNTSSALQDAIDTLLGVLEEAS